MGRARCFMGCSHKFANIKIKKEETSTFRWIDLPNEKPMNFARFPGQLDWSLSKYARQSIVFHNGSTERKAKFVAIETI